MKYRKKPVLIRAIQWDGDGKESFQKLKHFCPQIIDGGFVGKSDNAGTEYEGRDSWPLFIHTLEGIMCAQIGDWIIEGVNGEFYPCKPDIFEKTYEPADKPEVKEAVEELIFDAAISKALENKRELITPSMQHFIGGGNVNGEFRNQLLKLLRWAEKKVIEAEK